MSRLGNSSVSSLLSAATAAAARQQTYDDQIAAYEWDLSPKDQGSYDHYSSYIQGRLNKTVDPAKQLELQKKLTTTYRDFNSEQIQQASLAVNYGDISKTDKYKTMFGLYQKAIDNGDMQLAGNIESQLASLSVQIQNDADAAARASEAAGSKARTSSIAAYKTQLNDLENKIDLAYQTGQPLVANGESKTLNATDYAINRASILKAKHDMLSSLAQEDPRYADDLSSLEKSSDYRSLIESGMVQFDQGGHPIATPDLNNLAVKFTKDQYGNTVRSFTAPALGPDGKKQYGLVAPENGGDSKAFVADRTLDATPGGPTARVQYDLAPFQQNGKNLPDVAQYKDLISGNTVLAKTGGEGAGLRATAYNGKKESRTPEQAAEDLKLLTGAQAYQPGPLDGLFDSVNTAIQPIKGITSAAGKALGSFDLKKEIANLTHPNMASTSGILSSIFKQADFGNQQRAIEAMKQAAAQKAAQEKATQEAAMAAAAQASLRNSTSAASRAATPGPVRQYVPYAPPNKVYLPTPVAQSPASVFNAAKAAGKSTAAAIGNAVGYNF